MCVCKRKIRSRVRPPWKSYGQQNKPSRSMEQHSPLQCKCRKTGPGRKKHCKSPWKISGKQDGHCQESKAAWNHSYKLYAHIKSPGKIPWNPLPFWKHKRIKRFWAVRRKLSELLCWMEKSSSCLRQLWDILQFSPANLYAWFWQSDTETFCLQRPAPSSYSNRTK